MLRQAAAAGIKEKNNDINGSSIKIRSSGHTRHATSLAEAGRDMLMQTWEGLYNYFDRVSCWCCPLQPLSELKILYRHFPELWATLKEWDRRSWRKFKPTYSVEDLEQRFQFEDEWQKSGKPMNSKEFHTALKKYLEEKKNV